MYKKDRIVKFEWYKYPPTLTWQCRICGHPNKNQIFTYQQLLDQELICEKCGHVFDNAEKLEEIKRTILEVEDIIKTALWIEYNKAYWEEDPEDLKWFDELESKVEDLSSIVFEIKRIADYLSTIKKRKFGARNVKKKGN